MEVLIHNNACFPRASEESKTTTSIPDFVEYLNVSFTTLNEALLKLQSSINSESITRVNVNAHQKVHATDSTEAILNIHFLRAQTSLAVLVHLLNTLSGCEIIIKNDNSEASGSVVVLVQMTRTLQEKLAELATRSAVERYKQAMITKLADELEEFLSKITPVMYVMLYYFNSVPHLVM